MSVSSLNLERSFGFNHQLPNSVHYLSSGNSLLVGYAVSHNLILHNLTDNTQEILRGHRYNISALSSSYNRQYIASADKGLDSSIIIWDVASGIPVRTFFSDTLAPSSQYPGTASLTFSSDSQLLVSLSSSESLPQTISFWDWTSPNPDTHLLTSFTLTDSEVFNSVHISPFDPSLIIVLGPTSIQTCHIIEDSTSNLTVLSSKSLFLPTLSLPPVSFLPPSPHVFGSFVIGTTDGRGVVFGEDDGASEPGFCALRTVFLDNGASITAITQTDCLFYTTSSKGTVKVYDYRFRLVAWFDDIDSGPLTCLSTFKVETFDQIDQSFLIGDSLDNASLLSSFIVSSTAGVVVFMDAKKGFYSLEMEDKRGQIILETFTADVRTTSAFTDDEKSLIFCGDSSGVVKVFDLDSNTLLCKKEYTSVVSVIATSSVAVDDSILTLICLANGNIILSLFSLSSNVLTQVAIWSLKSAGVVLASWSPCNAFFSTVDCDGVLSLFGHQSRVKKGFGENLRYFEIRNDWYLIGKQAVFTNMPSGLVFIKNFKNSVPRLVACAEDSTIVEVDITSSVVAQSKPSLELSLRARKIIDPQSKIICFCFIDEGQQLVAFNDEFKARFIDPISFEVVRTVLAPVFSAPINKVFQSKTHPDVVFFSTLDRIIGCQMLPIDGNPAKSLGVLADGNNVNDLVLVEKDNVLRVVTVGGTPADQSKLIEGSLMVWNFDPLPLQQQSLSNGQGIHPFVTSLNCDDDFVEFLHDVFAFGCIKCKTESKAIVSPSLLPELLSAVDVFPSEWELSVLNKEAQMLLTSRTAVEGTECVGITFDDFVKIYFNYRRVAPFDDDFLDKCLGHLIPSFDPDTVPSRHELQEIYTPSEPRANVEVPADLLIHHLLSKGEKFKSVQELNQIISEITGDSSQALPDSINVETLMELLQMEIL
ncbi:hypothetical protein GEMRC1_007615 [Eukaryota sp. GEM-RC1]